MHSRQGDFGAPPTCTRRGCCFGFCRRFPRCHDLMATSSSKIYRLVPQTLPPSAALVFARLSSCSWQSARALLPFPQGPDPAEEAHHHLLPCHLTPSLRHGNSGPGIFRKLRGISMDAACSIGHRTSSPRHTASRTRIPYWSRLSNRRISTERLAWTFPAVSCRFISYVDP